MAVRAGDSSPLPNCLTATSPYQKVRRNAFARKTGRMFHIRKERGKMEKPIRLIQSYVVDKFFVSTAYRQSSAMVESPQMYYETVVFEWDIETRKTGILIDMQDSGSSVFYAMRNHYNICQCLVSALEETNNE